MLKGYIRSLDADCEGCGEIVAPVIGMTAAVLPEFE
jgi:hypothetical protein